ncbi:MAG: NAD-dependent deacylase [Tannerellaceae bacterium]|jgi:NAD-dependent deacetylase|nr:NAD-dependent deacylase [Tannerellaceae bacterium]
MKKRLVVLTGAGMSAESGIATFRDSNGLWNNFKVEDVATPEGFRANPELVLDFYNVRRRELLKARPNAGHYGLAALEKDFDVRIITQNVDNLHERAGSTSVLHLHGELMKVRPVNDPDTVYELSADDPDIHVGDTDANGVQLRPFIVWFNENVPLINEAAAITHEADILAVVGTSLAVYPAAGLLHHAPAEAPVFLIDPQPVSTPYRRVTYIAAPATEGVRLLAHRLNTYL